MRRPGTGPGALTAPPLLVIVGPTGVGKTAVAIEAAERIDGEIVGCDALQVYRGFDSATAKPDAVERARVRHHLVDCVDPGVDFTAAEYARRATETIAEIRGRGRAILVVGGTGMYLRALLRGVVDAPARDPNLVGAEATGAGLVADVVQRDRLDCPPGTGLCKDLAERIPIQKYGQVRQPLIVRAQPVLSG